MKTIAAVFLFLLIMPISSVGVADTLQDDAVFRAMQDELNRSSKELAIPGMSPPYLLSYRVREHQGATLEARYTAVTDSSTSRSRNLLINLRVGDPGLDNSNFYQDWRVTWTLRSTNQWYINSEGSRHRKGMAGQILEMSATLQAEDGQRLTGFVSHLLHQDDGLPPAAKLAEEARRLAMDLREMASASLLDEYVGPVLFTDLASAQFVSQNFVSQLALARKPITTEEWMNQRLPVGKLATKLKRRVLPSFVSIQDQPKLETWGGRRLVGTAVVDDEGMESQDITPVENGRLINLPLGRQPVEGLERSNGHSRSTSQQMTVPGITNLLVTSPDPRPAEKMLQGLRHLCREQGIEYGLLVRKLEDPRFSDLYRTTEREEESQPELLTPRSSRTESTRQMGGSSLSAASDSTRCRCALCGTSRRWARIGRCTICCNPCPESGATTRSRSSLRRSSSRRWS